MVFRSPDGTITNSHPIDAIVDDTMVGMNQPQSRPNLANEAQALAQDWADLLWLAGGSLELKNAIFTRSDGIGPMAVLTWQAMTQQPPSRSKIQIKNSRKILNRYQRQRENALLGLVCVPQKTSLKNSIILLQKPKELRLDFAARL